VAWSFFGVRKRADYEQRRAEAEPGARHHRRHRRRGALRRLLLVLLVRWVVGSGVAAG
jgi:hypothetical protein